MNSGTLFKRLSRRLFFVPVSEFFLESFIMRNTQNEHKAPFLSTAAVARWFGISTRTVCFWAECGEIPAMKVGRQWRFREEELRRWLDSSQDKLLAGRANPSSAA